MISIITKSEQETIDFACNFTKNLKPKDIICFKGSLGMGKTAFCKGISKGLECIDLVSSPTFSIVNVYRGKQIFAHFDMYRINTEQDLEMSGFYEYIDDGAILAIEWSENIIQYIDMPYIEITIEYINENTRKIIVKEIS